MKINLGNFKSELIMIENKVKKKKEWAHIIISVKTYYFCIGLSPC